jgi:hypothetical protein
MRRVFLFLCLIAVAAANSAGDVPADFEMLLLPIVTRTEGAFGSRWASIPWLFLDADAWILRAGPMPKPPHGVPPPPLLRQPEVVYLERQGSANPGVLLYVHRDDVVLYDMTLRLYANQTPVARLPVVRDDDYVRGVVRLLPVESNSYSRTMLRLYGKPGTNGTFVVRLREGGSTILFETVVTMEPDDLLEQFNGSLVPVRPSYAQVPIPGSDLVAQTRARFIEIAPASDEIEYWALATVTDNRTQAVDVLVPTR